MQQVADHWRQFFPDPSIKISVMPSNISYAIISPSSSVIAGPSGSSGTIPLGSASHDPVDAYDHAMGVI